MKRIVPLVVLVLAFAVPAAALADGAPAPGHSGNAGLRAAKRHLRRELRRCIHAPATERQACLQWILDRLDALKQRIDEIEAKVQQRCPGAVPATDTTSTPAAGDKCSRAPRLLARLERMKQRIDKLETKIRSFLSGGTSSGSDSSSSAPSSADADSIASLESQLTAVEAQNG